MRCTARCVIELCDIENKKDLLLKSTIFGTQKSRLARMHIGSKGSKMRKMIVAPCLLWLKVIRLLCEKRRNYLPSGARLRPFTGLLLLFGYDRYCTFLSKTKIKKILRATDGLVTEAARKQILLNYCFKRGFLQRKGGQPINSTPAGRAFIHVLPDIWRHYPILTAHWESILTQISEKQFKYQRFLWCH